MGLENMHKGENLACILYLKVGNDTLAQLGHPYTLAVRFLPKMFIQDMGVTVRPLEQSCYGYYEASEVFTSVCNEKLNQSIFKEITFAAR